MLPSGAAGADNFMSTIGQFDETNPIASTMISDRLRVSPSLR
jgi:hypothetical protein